MASGATYTPIATQTLGSAAPSVTFSSIPSTYTDLILVGNIYSTAALGVADLVITFNGDTTSGLYSFTQIDGDGTTATSHRRTARNGINVSYNAGPAPLANGGFLSISQIQNYSNTTTYKTLLSRANAASEGVDAFIGLWRNTAAIVSVNIASTSGNIDAASTLTLYGIAAA